ncbi:20033_t:CDS:2 [Funneliformis geosporum]|uniref:20033_t:CDS:1 n=1 Tax=Funneliformis geosporum TaxID=1117311 RepID=A0A9W4SH60_9GLOM|nr:20033_t:CDS:2 [Funneliformis geosporum]
MFYILKGTAPPPRFLRSRYFRKKKSPSIPPDEDIENFMEKVQIFELNS